MTDIIEKMFNECAPGVKFVTEDSEDFQIDTWETDENSKIVSVNDENRNKYISIDKVKEIALRMYDEGYSDSMHHTDNNPGQWWYEIEKEL